MGRRQYAGAAVETTTAGAIGGSGGGTVDIAASSGWPDGATGKFSIVVDPGQANEEKILVTSRTGFTLTYASGDRGYDSTAASAHSAGAACYLIGTAIDFDEANAHINATSAAHAATAISYAAGGTIAATTVQAAIAEVATDYVAADVAVAVAATVVTDALDTRLDAIEAANWVTGTRVLDGTLTAAKVSADAWTAYTPTWSGTIGNGTLTGWYIKIGRTVHWRLKLVWGTTTSHPASHQVLTVPPFAVAAATAALGTTDITHVGDGVAVNPNGGVSASPVVCAIGPNTGGFRSYYTATGSAITDLIPFTWNNTQFLTVSGTYESTT